MKLTKEQWDKLKAATDAVWEVEKTFPVGSQERRELYTARLDIAWVWNTHYKLMERKKWTTKRRNAE